jgi:hypothetical protein
MTRWKPIADAPHQPTAVSSPEPEVYVMRRPWLLALALVIVTFVACFPALRAGFIRDDNDDVTHNLAPGSSDR